MKKLILLISIIVFSCSTQKNNSENPIDFIYTPTSLDNFIIGSNENTMIVQKIHKAIIDKDFEKAYTYISDDIIMNNADGTSVEGLENFKSELKDCQDEVALQKNNIVVAKEADKKYETNLKNVRNNREYNSIHKEQEYQKLEIELSEKRIREFR